MKAILVIDMPNECGECPLLYDYLRCQAKEGVDIYGEERPDNCPLKPMPQKKDFFEEYMKVDRSMCKQKFDKVQEELRHQILGYNYCIDEILGETE